MVPFVIVTLAKVNLKVTIIVFRGYCYWEISFITIINSYFLKNGRLY